MPSFFRRIPTLILVTFLALTPCAAVIAGNLTGSVGDISDSEPLAKATVVVKDAVTGHEVASKAADANGTFKIENLPPGAYNVFVSIVGYAPRVINDVVIENEGDTEVMVELEAAVINIGDISVTASRRQEKAVEAPAAVSVVSAGEIESRATLTPTDHIKGLAAVDIASTGLNQSNVTTRGFNNIFSGALLVLTDNRIARVPSLRFNAYNFIPTVNEDIDRIEVVSGPGSALYGPNAASGVMHILTKSPFASPGTSVSLAAGEREVMIGSFRHAGIISQDVAYKVTGQYYRGQDWEHHESTEPEYIQKFRPSTGGPVPVGDQVSNARNFDIEKLAGEGRFDFVLGDDASLILNGGFNRASSIELTGLGAAQAIGWTYSFGQARFKYKDLYIQSFVNMSDAGETYLLQTGQLIVDRSRLWAGQVQHRYDLAERFNLIYGLDVLLTRPNTDGTINGGNEQKDNINEYGAYLQAETQLRSNVKLLGAMRVDENNRLEDLVYSPRAAIAWQPRPDHNLRFTYNSAYSTPDNNNLYLDILQSQDVGSLGELFTLALGFSPEFDIRVEGVPESGFHWSFNDNGPQFRSSFAPVAGLNTSDFIDFNDPMFTNVMWGIGRSATLSGFQNKLEAANVPEAQITALSSAINSLAPNMVTGVENRLMTIDPDRGVAVPSAISDIADIGRLQPTITKTLEMGYTGVLSDRFKIAVSGYYTKKNDFIGPLTVETPNVFMDPATLQTYLTTSFATAMANPDNSDEAATVAALDNVSMGGNGNGTPIDELVTMFTTGAASIPFGTVSPIEASDPTAVLVTYRNFGDISFYGSDLALDYHLNRNWNIGGTYSYISKNFFEKSADQVHDINLNAPRHKFGVYAQFTHPGLGLTISSRFRFVDGFEMDSPFYGSVVESYRVLDLNASMRLQESLRLSVTVQNMLDERHIEFIGGPELGRLAIARVTWTL